MKFKFIALAAAFLASQASAFIGFGVHYAPAFGTKLAPEGYSDVTPEKIKAISEAAGGLYSTKISYEHDGMDAAMIHGLGIKVWVDSLTIVDFEATVNLQYGSYNARIRTDVTQPNLSDPTNPDLIQTASNEKDLQIDLSGTPFGMATPKFVSMNGDLSVTYAFLTNVLTVVRPYVGGGLTVYMNTFVMDDDFIKELVNDEEFQNILIQESAAGATEDAEAAAEKKAQMIKDKIKQQAQKQSLNYSIGGHVLLGARVRFPYVPIAAYINGKYYFGGTFPEEISQGRIAAEAGIGLSF